MMGSMYLVNEQSWIQTKIIEIEFIKDFNNIQYHKQKASVNSKDKNI